ncbi:protein rhsD [Escherichia coli O104:H4 str. 04-8351]|nr:protein rhsD [Escherichia coli O104:H4 str. 04-8351]
MRGLSPSGTTMRRTASRHRTVNGDTAEQWQYDGHGWLREISHLSEGHRVAVHYGYDDKGRLTGERADGGEPGDGGTAVAA